MANRDIKLEAAGNGVAHWQIAQALGITPQWFSVKLRNEFSDEEKAKIREIIDRLKEPA